MFPPGTMSRRSRRRCQRILQLPLGHLRATLDVTTSRLLIKHLTGMPTGLAGARDCRAMAACRLLAGIADSHRLGAFPLSVGAYVRPAFVLLLRRSSALFLL